MLTAALSTDQAAVRVPAKPYSSVPVAAYHACRGQPPRVVGVHHRQLPARCAVTASFITGTRRMTAVARSAESAGSAE